MFFLWNRTRFIENIKRYKVTKVPRSVHDILWAHVTFTWNFSLVFSTNLPRPYTRNVKPELLVSCDATRSRGLFGSTNLLYLNRRSHYRIFLTSYEATSSSCIWKIVQPFLLWFCRLYVPTCACLPFLLPCMRILAVFPFYLSIYLSTYLLYDYMSIQIYTPIF
jgi:hypothetical protein